MNIEEQIQKNQAARLRMAAFFGTLAGGVFAGVAWGIDGYQLWRAHAMLPFLQFGLGAVTLALIGTLAGFLTYRLNNLFASLAIWLATGWVFAQIGGHMSFQISSAALQVLAPGIAAQVSYPYVPAAAGFQSIITVVTMGLSLLAGFLATTLIENAVEAGAPVARIIPFIAWMALFGLAGLSVQDNLTNRFTAAVAATDQWVEFGVQNEGKSVDPKLAASMHLRSLEPIKDLIHRPRKLIAAGYDEYLTNLTVLIDFDGVAVRCSTFNHQVNVCER